MNDRCEKLNIDDDVTSKLKSIRLKMPKNIIISYININSIRNKIKNLEILISDLVDVLTIAETKIDGSFSTPQFLLKNFKTPFRLDVSDRSGGLMTYIRADIPSRLLMEYKFPIDIQILPIELNLKKAKWLLLSIYRNPKQDLNYFLNYLAEVILFYSRYDSILINGDFNVEPDNHELSRFLACNHLHNHVKEKTCWKSANGTCIDLIVSNKKYSLMNTGTIETGLSDHHLLVYTMLKTTYQKLPPKVIKYREWKFFDEYNFKFELARCLQYNNDFNVNSYFNFEKVFKYVLDKHAPVKTKFLRGNNQPHVTKELRKAIMLRSKLKNKANRTKNALDLEQFRRQRNFVVTLNRKTKRSFFADTQHSQEGFWKAVSPYFGKKSGVSEERILLVEDNNIISDESKLSTIFNSYFNSITDSLKIPEIPGLIAITDDPVSNAISKFAQHPSINTIKNSCRNDGTEFELSKISRETLIKEVIALNPKKAVSGAIPIKALKVAIHECADTLTSIFNTCIVESSSFPDELKLAEIIPAHKKNETTDKSNYRPISLLPVISKVYERIFVKQLEPFVDKFLSKFLCGFRKGYSCQHSLLNMIRKWKACLNKSGVVGSVLMDLSKAFDCLPHDLLIAKLNAYGIGRGTLRLLANYLNKRKHYTRVGSTISGILEVLLGVPQGSVLGPLLFNIFINDLLLLCREDICNFADDNTMSVCSVNLPDALYRINNEIGIVLNWFCGNGMVANPHKFQLIFLGIGHEQVINIKIGALTITSAKEVKLLGITLDSKLSFFPHVVKICGKAMAKIKTLRRIRKYLTQKQADSLFHSYIMSPFNYCPLVWMFCSKQANTLLNSTHFKGLRARYSDFSSTFDELLQISNSTYIHSKNLRLMLFEVYKTVNHLNPEIMWDSFNVKKVNKYTLRRGENLEIPLARTTRAKNSFDFRAIMAWNQLAAKVKNASSLNKFKAHVKNISIYCECINCS